MENMIFALYFMLISLAAASQELQLHSNDDESNCAITGKDFTGVYSSLVEDMGIVDPQSGKSCSLPQDSITAESYQSLRADHEFCETLFNFSQLLLVDLNASSECCLQNASSCEKNSTTTKMDKARAYGYGTLMVVVLSALSLLGVIIVPLIRNHHKFGLLYEYVRLALVAMGMSALLSDAILHLIPEIFEHVVDTNLGPDGLNEKAMTLNIIWRACSIMGGLYFFYLFEIVLRKLMTRATGGKEKTKDGNEEANPDPAEKLLSDNHHKPFVGSTEESHEVKYKTIQSTHTPVKKESLCSSLYDIKPLAILIILGDSFHNFIDGIALGAAMSHSFAIGLSTAIALIFHEIPHELGDYAILLITGMKWHTALLFNFLSSLTALAGFYIGVSVGLSSEEATSWMLSGAAGTFFYISLVDLLPEIINHKLNGWLAMVLVNLGFIFSFIVLLLVAIYEDKF